MASLPPERDSESASDRDAPVAAPSRRAFVFLGALAAASAPRPARAQAPRTRQPAPRPRFRTAALSEVSPVPGAWKDPVARLVRRTTMGLTAVDLADARRMGYHAWLEQQLRGTRLPDDLATQMVAAKYPMLSQTPEQLSGAKTELVTATLQQATMLRAVLSKRQLYERMVEFWSDHFNISTLKVGYLKIADDRDVIRKHALGKFSDLVMASAKSPAMLAYLDQTQSRAGRPNQNYARELMELHTLGVDGGYSQTDVAELSRVLTGWTIQGRGTFAFDPASHDWGAKTVLGLTIPAGSVSQGQEGIKEGERVIAMLVSHPSTARFVSTKMLRWLLTTEPTETQIRTVSSVFRATKGDISAMVRAILNDGWMVAAPAKFKRPFHYVVSAARAVGGTYTAGDTLHAQVNTIGQPLFVWETPDGYPDKAEYWSGNIAPRWNSAMAISAMRTASVTVDAAPYMIGGVDGTVDTIAQRVFGGEIAAATRDALRGYLAGGTYNETRVRETLGLALASADFQWY